MSCIGVYAVTKAAGPANRRPIDTQDERERHQLQFLGL
jgi:hypothetical protein